MNLLKEETSPYLRQHRDNPVHWMPWGPAALAKAKAENKPILLSIGYSACHWCHVMAHESFEDETTADLMNHHFINIKVDREERPDLDAIYQNALSLMGKQGGWPLTMFLTAEGKPFWGGTYFPPEPKYGMPSFREILRGVADSFAGDKEKIDHNVESLTAALTKLNSNQHGHLVHRDMLDKISAYFLGLIDPAHGGIGTAPKFPNLTILNLLWSTYIRTGNDSYKSAVIHSLTQICQGGIYDHLGGGFSRYAVDAEWLVPHFEKMLYDNAQFVALLTEVYKETEHPLFAERLSETIAFVQRDLSVRNLSHTAFATAIDADSEGVEGKYYVWTEAEIDKILGYDSAAFKKAYDVTRFGNWEHTNILNRLKMPEYGTGEEETRLREWRQKLKGARDQRIAPGLDNKVLADNNGLMISALAKAGFALDCMEWVEAAANAFRFITSHMMDSTGRLQHVWCEGRAQHTALLEDYANMADAALALQDVTQDPAYLAQAVRWVEILNEDYLDQKTGGYFMAAALATDLLLRPKSAYDSATPSGNGTMVGVLARLYHLTGQTLYADLATKTAEAFSGEIHAHFFPFATLLNNSDFLLNPVTVTLLSAPGSAAQKEFHDVLRHISLPSLIKTDLPFNAILPENHPAFGKRPLDQKPTVYVCFGPHCLPPLTTAQELDDLLHQERHKRSRAAANDG